MLLVYYEMANAPGGYAPTSCAKVWGKDREGFGQTGRKARESSGKALELMAL